MTRFIFLFFLSFIQLSLSAQENFQDSIFYEDDEIIHYDFASDQNGFHLFTPKQQPKKNLPVVVFIHGYGALNPMIYGKWIRALVNQDRIVIYPRYQERLLVPAASEFPNTTSMGIKSALTTLDEMNCSVERHQVYYIGHSYGGVIAAYLSARYDSLDIPSPAAAFICEPGTGPLTGAILEDYTDIPASTLITIIVGENDMTVGQKFGEYLFEKLDHLNNKSLIYQNSFEAMKLTSSHYEPYSIDTTFDIGHRNFTSNKAFNVSKLDEVDTKIYWPTFELMFDASRKKRTSKMRNVLWPMIRELGSSAEQRAILDVKYE